MLSAGGTLMGVRLLNCSILPEVFEKKLLKAVYTQLYQIYPRELKSYVNTRPCCSPAASCSLSLQHPPCSHGAGTTPMSRGAAGPHSECDSAMERARR